MSALNRKLLRELWRLRGQMFSISLVVATGIMTVVTLRGGYDSLVVAQREYYQQARFANIWAPLKRAPEALRKTIAGIPGVAAVDTRLTFLAMLDLEGLDAPAQGRFVSLPRQGRPVINDIHIRSGRYLQPGSSDEVLVSEKFAQARGLRPGDSLRAVINGRARTLDIVGIAISPEHTYSVPAGSLFPDDERYGVLWMGREALEAAYAMDGAFNEVLLTLAPGANEDEVIAGLDLLLDPYGGLGAYPRRDQLSHQVLDGELDQNRVMGTSIPLIFLAVAAFLLNLVLGRLIATQRGDIAVLKAFGYRDAEVGRHYLLFALTTVAAGALVGGLAGHWLGHQYMHLYARYFEFPDLSFRPGPGLLWLAVLISAGAAGAGSLLAVRRAVGLPPAEAMRPEPPANFSAGWLERSGLVRWLPPSLRMILRYLQRKPWQAFLSALGVAFSVAILVIGMFMYDGMNRMMDLQFRVIQREDLSLTFNEPLDANAAHDLRHLEGVTRVETFRLVPARLRAGHRHREVAIQGMEAGGHLRQIVSEDGVVFPVPAEGMVLSATLANKLQVRTGDTLMVEVLEGRRSRGVVPIAGVVRDFLGLSAYMSQESLQRLARGENLISGAYLAVAADAQAGLGRRLKNLPVVASVVSPAAMQATFEAQLAQSLFIAIAFLVGFAGVIAVGVVYNGARIALSERGHELACLRVMGYRRQEAATLLLGEQAIVTLCAIPMGWLLGYILSLIMVTAVQTDTYRVPFVIQPGTYLLAALITVLAAAASGAMVRRRVDRLDLVAVLKTRE